MFWRRISICHIVFIVVAIFGQVHADLRPHWEYEKVVTSKNTRSEIREGILKCDGIKISRDFEHVITPIGEYKWRKAKFGSVKWVLISSKNTTLNPIKKINIGSRKTDSSFYSVKFKVWIEPKDLEIFFKKAKGSENQ